VIDFNVNETLWIDRKHLGSLQFNIKYKPHYEQLEAMIEQHPEHYSRADEYHPIRDITNIHNVSLP
jgi:hypothetical protein